MSRIPVHQLTTLQASGTEQVDRMVECPDGRRSVPIEACLRCGHGSGTSHDEAQGLEVVECERDQDTGESAAFEARIHVVPALAVATRDVLGVAPDASLEQVRALMLEAVIGCLPVLDGGRPVGIITPLDLVTRAGARTAAEAMTAPVATIHETTSVVRAAALMAFEGIHHLPVVNPHGSIVAMLSSLDILRHLGREQGFLVPNESTRRRARSE